MESSEQQITLCGTKTVGEVVMVGAGNVATHLARAWHRRGISICQVYSRTETAARMLADEVGAEAVTTPDALVHHASLYVVALRDDALTALLPQLTEGRGHALWVHTAGSVPMDVFTPYVPRYGVFYPMQTFSKQCEVDFSEVSLFVESALPQDLALLKQLARLLSPRVFEADSVRRKCLHLAAVFTCNFVNHLYALADELLQAHGLPFEAMLPLIDETARKAHRISPLDGQTGPAARRDVKVMQAHMDMLSDWPELQQLYHLLSESIMKLQTKKIPE